MAKRNDTSNIQTVLCNIEYKNKQFENVL